LQTAKWQGLTAPGIEAQSHGAYQQNELTQSKEVQSFASFSVAVQIQFISQHTGSHFHHQTDQTSLDLVPVLLDKYYHNETHQCKWEAMLEASARRSRNS